jgi:hypothetical protein
VDGWHILLNDIFCLGVGVCSLFCGWPCYLPQCSRCSLSYGCLLMLLNVVASVTYKESYVRCFMFWHICIFCCLLWVACFNLSVMVWELKDCISDCFIYMFCCSLWVLCFNLSVMVWELKDYLWLLLLLDWYFGHISILKQSVQYQNLLPALRPPSHIEELLIPELPELWNLEDHTDALIHMLHKWT